MMRQNDLIRAAHRFSGRQRAAGVHAPEELSRIVTDAPQPVIACDVFDTLLKRTVIPEHTKPLAADLLVRRLGLEHTDGPALYALRRAGECAAGQRMQARCGENEFLFADLARWLHERLKTEEPAARRLAPEAFLARMLEVEIAVERRVTSIVRPVSDALKAAARRGRRVILVSDFYLPAASLKEVLAAAGALEGVERLYVSCDCLASKRSGRLYDHVLRELDVGPEEVLMIGDDPHADGRMAASRGIRSVLLAADGLSRHHDVTSIKAAEREITRVVARSPLGEARNFRPLAVCLLLFIERLHGALWAAGHRHVAFLAREGQPLREMFLRYQDALSLPAQERIACHYLKVSRRSTFIASLRALDEEDFAALRPLYERMTLVDFLRTLGFGERSARRLLDELSMPAQTVIDLCDPKGALARLRDHDAFRTAYERRRRDQRALLRRYVEQQGVPLAAHPLIVVDVGWKGSMQDFLHRALKPPHGTCGYYLGLFPIGRRGSMKRGLLFEAGEQGSPHWRVYAENPSMFEILLCADHPPALAYVEDDRGRVQVVDDTEDPEELEWITRNVRPVRDDLLKAFDELLALRWRYVLPTRAWEGLAARHFARLAHAPWRPAMRWLSMARHREHFGVFRTSGFHEFHEMRQMRRAPSLWRRVRFTAALVLHPRVRLRATRWPAAAIHHHLGRAPAWFYGWLRRRMAGL